MSRRSALWAWRMASSLALAGGVIALPVLALTRRRWLRGLTERLGGGVGLGKGSPVWIHAASVGEVRLALPLLRGLAEMGTEACLSTSTVAGRDLGRREMPQIQCFLAPLDHAFPVQRVFRQLQPRVLVLIETELWPEMLEMARRRGVPVFLVNGRISDRSFGRYRRLRRWLAPLLEGLTGFWARTEVDAARLMVLGGRPEACLGTGDLKSISLPEVQERALRQQAPWMLLTGSLHAIEFEAWVQFVVRTRDLPLAHVVAPRHLEALPELLRLLARHSITPRLWSQYRPQFPQPIPSPLIVDTIGDLQKLWAEADLALVGGTLNPKSGGHNVLEPAAWGKPVLYGPGMADHRRAASLLENSGGGRSIQDLEELEAILRQELGWWEAWRAMGCRAAQAVRKERESAQSLLEAILGAIQTPAARSTPLTLRGGD